MIVGILSDTHGRGEMAAVAVRPLRARGAQFLIHCGDVGAQAVLDHLAGLSAAFVFGNNDYHGPELDHYAQHLGIRCLGRFGELELDGKQFAVLHGDDFALRRRLIAEQRHDYLLQGHTHVPSDERIGRIRLINPGALHRARPKTVALLDTATDALSFLTVAE